MLKYFGSRIAVIILLIIGTQVVYDQFFFEKDLLKHSDVIKLVRDVDPKTDILYIGESSNSSSHSEDFDERKISEFISDFYPNLVVDDITKPAAHARNYHILLNHIPKDNQIQTLIVTLNLRSFGIGWIQSDLETSLNKSMVLLEDGPSLYKRFRLAFKDYDNKTKQERSVIVKRRWKHDELNFPDHFEHNTIRKWDGYLFKTGIHDKNGQRSNAKTQMACHFVKNYAYEIDTLTNPRIEDFNHIIQLAKRNNWNIVFNLLAENTELGHQLVGDNWTYIMNKNRDLLVNYFTRKGVTVIDNMHAVPDHLFTDRDWTTEHYHEEGRQTIARNVANGLKQFHPKNYHPHVYLSQEEIWATKNVYSHNMEKNKRWTGENFTNEKAHSGQKSCKINKNNLYSVTLEIPYNKLNSSFKNSIQYSMNVYADKANPDAYLIIEIHDSKDGNKNLQKKLSDFQLSQNWNSISHTFQIPDIYKDAELIKVFVYNPTETDVFIDDVNIIFE